MPSSFYWDEVQMISDGANPDILAVGDSWFWYPFVGGNLINYLGPLVESHAHVILVKGNNGVEAQSLVDGRYKNIVREMFRLYGSTAKAVFISAGGNDFAGMNDLRPLLKANCAAETSAAGCFKDGPDGFDRFFAQVDEDYRKLIGLAYTHTMPDCKIVLHTYAYAFPDGRGVLGGPGWLKPALDDARVPLQFHKSCMELLLDRFYEVLTNISKMDAGHIAVVDSRRTLPNLTDWSNELHPTAAGFMKVAAHDWHPVLRTLNLAA